MSTTPDDPMQQPPQDSTVPQDGTAPQSGQQQPQYAQPAYGQPQYAQPQYAQPYGTGPSMAPTGPRPETEKNWMNITSLVLAIIGLFTWVTAIGGVILGHMGRSAARKGEADNGGFGLAGLIISYVVLVLGVAGIIALIAFFGWLGSECGGDNPADWCTSSNTSIEIQAVGSPAGLTA